MRSHTLLTVALGAVELVTAGWAGNLNYRSPSESHPSLGIAIHRVVKRNSPDHCWKANQLKFTHNVASGDPYPESVILWTRIAPHKDNDDSNVTVSGYVPLYNHETSEYVEASRCPICVEYTVSRDEAAKDVADSGKAYTSSDIDYTVKVEAKNLDPFTRYYYQFKVCGSDVKSSIGRTKTTPRPDDKVASVNLAVFSCSNYPFGHFNAYGNVVRKDNADFVIHLGDYLYEYENGYYGWGDSLDRISLPNKEIFSLYDYRKRIATYRTDEDLAASHQTFPWIPVWDDHEIGDNQYRDGSSELHNNEKSFVKAGRVSVDQRKMNAVRAYFEWMPIRQVDMDDNLRIWRSFKIGSLMDLIMLDTRNYDRSITDLYYNTDYIHEIANDAGRSLMGGRQERWFYDELIKSADRGATWRVIGNQIIFSRMNQSIALGKKAFNVDAWDGYMSNKNRTFSHLYDNNINNNIMLAGDSHASWVSDLAWLGEKKYDPKTGEGAIGVEFAGTAVSSPCPLGQNITQAQALKGSKWLVGANEELQWQDLFYRGYYSLSISPEKIDASFFGVPQLLTQNPFEISLANFTVYAGANKLARPIAGGSVEFGALQDGKTVQTNWTVNTETGKGFVSHFKKGI